jgi:pyruvate-formate lyase-activating enzyme
MHLIDVLALRPVPAGALFLALTRRCPLSCAHCSTNSMLSSEEHDGDMFLRFVDTFTADDRPEVILMSGGEALLRPQLVRELAESARSVGCSSQVLSGMFFARGARIPRPILRAIEAVDHFSASLDKYHEREVSRAQVFRMLDQVMALGKDVSLHIVGLGDDDPYVAGLVDDIRRHFDDRMPILVGNVGATGRAREWLDEPESGSPDEITADPCAIANWPLVAFDGTIVGCCNQDVVDRRPVPDHLRLGHAAEDDWSDVRERYLRSTLMRGVRLFGPEYVADRFSDSVNCDGYCETCIKLSSDATLERRLAEVLARPSTELIARQVELLQRSGGAIAFARRAGIARYADLIALGYDGPREAACVA